MASIAGAKALLKQTKYAEMLNRKIKNAREESAVLMRETFTAAVTGLTAGTAGFIDEKWGAADGSPARIGPFPITFALGSVMHLVGYGLDIEKEREVAPYVHAIGSGYLAAFAYAEGRAITRKFAK